MDLNAKSVDMIQICASGLKWQCGKQIRMAAWPEIALVDRVTIDTSVKKQAMAVQFGLAGALAASMGNADDGGKLVRQRDTVTVQLQRRRPAGHRHRPRRQRR